jgi:diguanylate cyclase (GGDEF)-like protein
MEQNTRDKVVMTTNKHAVKYKYILIVFSFVFYILCVYLYTSTTLVHRENESIAAIDERLKVGAYAVYYLLGDDFFRRATQRDSISPEEDWSNIRKLTSFNKQAGLAFLYCLIKKDGNFYVISSSATQSELNRHTELHYFYHYDTATDELASIFENQTPKIVEYQDKWGRFRGIFIPIKIDGSQTVVMASEVELSYLENALNAVKVQSYKRGFLFLIFFAPIVLSIGYLLKAENMELQELLYTDSLTNLPNRLFLIKHLDDYFSTPKIDKQILALFHVDIDDFKEINDGFGYRIGDYALKSIANRIHGHFGSRGIVTRYESDDFFIVMNYENMTNAISDSAQEVLDLFTNPIEADSYQFYISCSVGISLFPIHAKSTSELIQNAHMATAKAKEGGINGYQFFNSEINTSYNKKCELRQHINTAINNNEYYLVYQPQYNAATSAIVGVEALLRWQHPSKGLILPSEFIPYAENSGLIIEIEKIVLKKAFSKGAEWKNDGVIPSIRIAINISPQLLYQDTFIQIVNDLLVKYGCSPDILKFEITEQVVIKNQIATIAKLHKIQDMGIEISLDDFGSGYSSLTYLKDLPVDQIKIDRSFIVNITQERRNQAIIDSIVQLCRGLNLSVIAEGAETKEEVDYLLSVGCEFVQGFYFSKPLDNAGLFNLMNHITTH